MKPIQIDGSSGGGQMLRTALSLAMVTGQPFRMTNIRGKRPRPGLMRQHLTCVKAACEISSGTADGAEIGSTELVFRASDRIAGKDYQFAIGTAGSTTLLFQTLLPALLRADKPSTLRLEGGTHDPLAPPFEFIERVFLPLLRRMGAQVEVRLLVTGFAPAGGGVMECEITPLETGLSPIELLERPAECETRIRVLTSHLPLSIAGRMLDAAVETLPSAKKEASVESREPTPGQGICCLAEADFGEGLREITTGHGEPRVKAESVGHHAAKALKDFLSCGAPVSRHLADQLLLPLALAGGGSFLSASPDGHLATNISVISKFLPVSFNVEEAARGCRLVSVQGG